MRRESRYDHFYVLANEFAKQMQGLVNAGYRAVSLKQIKAALDGSAELPPKAFAVTFDDGYHKLYRHVHPIMIEKNIPYTVFLVSDMIGKTSSWVQRDGFETAKLLSWNEIAEMADWTAIDFQGHTANHVRLADVPVAEAKEELSRCKTSLEQRLRRPIDTICYPYGSVSERVTEMASELGFTMGVTTQFGRVRQCDDVLQLPRVAIHHVPPFSIKFGLSGPNFWWRIKTRKDTRQGCQ